MQNKCKNVHDVVKQIKLRVRNKNSSFHLFCTKTELHFQREKFTSQQKEINTPRWACLHTNNFKAGYQKSLKIASGIRTTGSISKDPSLHAAIQYT